MIIIHIEVVESYNLNNQESKKLVEMVSKNKRYKIGTDKQIKFLTKKLE